MTAHAPQVLTFKSSLSAANSSLSLIAAALCTSTRAAVSILSASLAASAASFSIFCLCASNAASNAASIAALSASNLACSSARFLSLSALFASCFALRFAACSRNNPNFSPMYTRSPHSRHAVVLAPSQNCHLQFSIRQISASMSRARLSAALLLSLL